MKRTSVFLAASIALAAACGGVRKADQPHQEPSREKPSPPAPTEDRKESEEKKETAFWIGPQVRLDFDEFKDKSKSMAQFHFDLYVDANSNGNGAKVYAGASSSLQLYVTDAAQKAWRPSNELREKGTPGADHGIMILQVKEAEQTILRTRLVGAAQGHGFKLQGREEKPLPLFPAKLVLVEETDSSEDTIDPLYQLPPNGLDLPLPRYALDPNTPDDGLVEPSAESRNFGITIRKEKLGVIAKLSKPATQEGASGTGEQSGCMIYGRIDSKATKESIDLYLNVGTDNASLSLAGLSPADQAKLAALPAGKYAAYVLCWKASPDGTAAKLGRTDGAVPLAYQLHTYVSIPKGITVEGSEEWRRKRRERRTN